MCDASVEAVNNKQQQKSMHAAKHNEGGKKRYERWAIREHLRVTNYIVSVLNEQL